MTVKKTPEDGKNQFTVPKSQNNNLLNLLLKTVMKLRFSKKSDKFHNT